jgi:hypothetical protein
MAVSSRQQPPSSQDFVRALKAPSDPPVEGGPTKIDIAEAAWANKAFYVLCKGEVITEWILTKLLKEKDKETCVWNQSLLFCAEAYINPTHRLI